VGLVNALVKVEDAVTLPHALEVQAGTGGGGSDAKEQRRQ
jgi:hypothetical protein